MSATYLFVSCEDFVVCEDYRFKKNRGSGFIIPNISKNPLSFVESSGLVKTLDISLCAGTMMSSMIPIRI